MSAAEEDRDEVPSVLADRYAIEERIGSGASSVVYRAVDERYGRLVAVKILRAELAGAIGGRRFLQEVQLAARLQHPHILPLYDSGEFEGRPFYVMPYVEGRSLRAEIRETGPLPLERVVGIAREVGSALEYAHAHGVVHRDVKPENILLIGGHATVSDFGIARAILQAAGDRLTTSGIVVGTPSYMSPEQAGGGDVDERSDVYSMGCVVYEMLTGAPPFEGSTAFAMLAQHVTAPVPDVRTTRAQVPASLGKAVSKSMAKPREDRFHTVSAFVAALDVEPLGAARGRPGRRGLTAVAALVGVGAVLVTATLVLRPPGTAPDARKTVVFPLAELDVPRRLAGSGYDVALMIGAAMEQTDPLKWTEGAPRLTPGQRDDPSRLTSETLRAITLAAGARYYLDGVVRGDADSVLVTLRLHDALGDSLVVRRTVSGPLDTDPPFALALAALPSVLPALLEPGRVVDLTPLADRDIAAVALFIQGERAYGESRFAASLDFFDRAVDLDPAFAFAAAKGAQAASWLTRIDEARDLVASAQATDSILPARYRAFTDGLGAYWTGAADSAATLLRGVVDDAPDWAEAHMALGEVYYHLLPAASGPLDSIAEREFSEARRLDHRFTPPLLHLAEIRLRRGDTVVARRLMDELTGVQVDPELVRGLRLGLQCVREDPDAAMWDDSASEDPLAALTAAAMLGAAGNHPACAEAGYSAVLRAQALDATNPLSWGAAVGLQGLYMAEERLPEAVALLDSVFAAGRPHAIILYLMNDVAGAPVETQATIGDQYVKGMVGEGYERMTAPLTLWAFGVWNAHLGHVDVTRRLFEQLAAAARASGSRDDQTLADALAAHLALAEGDTATAIRRLRAVRPTADPSAIDWSLADALPLEKLLLARLLLATGRAAEAESVARGFDHPEPVIYVSFLRQSLMVRRDAARVLGARDRVASYEARLDALVHSQRPPSR